MPSLMETISSYVPRVVARRFASHPELLTHPIGEQFETAVLYADMPGFTPLTERLTKLGPSGVEALSELLNNFMGKLVGIILDHGGDVIKFAGDSLIAIWPEEEDAATAALRAAQCGLAIQTQLRDYRTREGYPLAVRIGISAGTVDGAHLGGVFDRWEFVIDGEPLQKMSIAERLSDSGQVVLAPAAWQETAAFFQGELLQDGYFRLDALTQSPPITAAVPVQLSAEATPSLHSYIPGAIKSRLAAGHTDWLAELRRVTVLFIALPTLNIQELMEAQNILQTLQNTLYHYEGSVNKVSVDDKGITVVAGLGLPPLAHEDDALLGVLAARAIYDVLQQLGTRCAIGIATGHIFCGTVGNSRRREYTMLGDVVNLAARLMQAANRSNAPIFCDRITQEEAADRFRFKALPPIQLKGKQTAVPIFQPLGERRTVQDSERALNSIVGREKERAMLRLHLERLKEGESGVIIIEGEAGIGKSRLIDELQEQAADLRLSTFLGTGSSIERAASYHGWRGVFSQMFDISLLTDAESQRQHLLDLLEDDPERIAQLPLLNPVLPFTMPDNEQTAQMNGQSRADNTRNLLISLIQESVLRSPKVIILEDAHWFDSASWALALAVSRRVRPLLLVVATRPLPRPMPAAYTSLRRGQQTHHLALEAMSEREILTLIRARLNVNTLSPTLANMVVARGEGNPFYSEELIYALRDADKIVVDNDECRLADDVVEVGLSLPDTVQGIVTSRIDRLDPASQLVLKVASVIGRFFDYNTLHDIYPIPAEKARLTNHLQTLEQRALTLVESPEPDLSYTFKHIITQEVAYNMLLFEQRRQLHQAVAEWYERHYGGPDGDTSLPNTVTVYQAPEAPALSPHYAILVHHYHHAGNQERERHYALRAGQQAAEQFANDEAVTYFSRALELTPHTDFEPLYTLILAREQVYNLLGLRSEQAHDLQVLQLLADQLDDDERRAAVATRHARYAERVSNYPTAIQAAKQAIEIAQAVGNIDSEAGGYLYWGRALMRQGMHEMAGPKLETGFALAQREGLRHYQAEFATSLSAVYRGRGNTEKAYEMAYLALRLRREIGDRRGEAESLNSIGNTLRGRGSYDEAQDNHQSALEIYRETGDRQGEAQSLDALSSVHANQGSYATARVHCLAALRIKREIGDRRGQAQSLNNLGNVANNQADYAAAIACFEKAYTISQRIGDKRGEALALNNLGVAAALQGQQSEAQQYYTLALPLQQETSNQLGEAWIYNNLGTLSRYEGAYAQAESYFDRALEIQRKLRYRKGAGITLNNLAAVFRQQGHFAKAEAHHEQALEVVRQIGYLKGESLVLAHASLLAVQKGTYDIALEMGQRSLHIAERASNPTVEALALTHLGRTLHGMGLLNDAQTMYEKAIRIRQRNGESHLLPDPLAGLAAIFMARGKVGEALAHLSFVLNRWSEGVSAAGCEEPFRVYRLLVEVLQATEDDRAGSVLKTAVLTLNHHANALADQTSRDAFLNLPDTKALLTF